MPQIKRVLVNPGRRRTARGPKRPLTRAQILAGFGGKSAQAAAGGAPKKASRRRKRRNPSQAIRVAVSNPSTPHQGGNTVKKTAQRRRRISNPVARRRNSAPRARAARSVQKTVTKYRYRTRRSNPVARRPRRANPRQSQALAMLRKGALVAGGAVGARILPQALMGARNSGKLGVAMNLLAALVLGGVTNMVTRKREDGALVTIGGVAGAILRFVQESTPYAGIVQGSLSGYGVAGDMGVAGLGRYAESTFFHPLAAANGRNGVANMMPSGLMNAVDASVSRQLAAPKAQSLSGLRRAA